MSILRLRTILGLAVGALVATVAGPASASGFLTDQFGSDHGHPALGNTYSVYFNPGAMAGMSGTELTADGVIAARSLEFDRYASSLSGNADPTYQQSNTGSATLFNVLGAPYIGFVTDFGGSKWRLGVASYIPFGGQVSWQKNNAYANSETAPGAYDGPQRWATISASTSSLYETAAVAYRFDQARLGLGASFSVIRTGVTDARARNSDGSDDITLGTGGLKEGRSLLDVSGLQVGAGAGVYWEATRDGALRLGLSYTSQPNFGTMRLKGTFHFTPGNAAETAQDADFLQAYPDVVRLGAAWRVSPEGELRLDVDYQRWSAFKNQCLVAPGASCPTDSHGINNDPNSAPLLNLPRDWNDTVRARLGGAYWIVPETELFGSFAFESAPVAKKWEDPLIFDSTRLQGTLGMKHAFSKHVWGSLSYTYVYFIPMTVNDSALATTGQPPSTSPSENGHYSSELYVFDAAVSYRF